MNNRRHKQAKAMVRVQLLSIRDEGNQKSHWREIYFLGIRDANQWSSNTEPMWNSGFYKVLKQEAPIQWHLKHMYSTESGDKTLCGRVSNEKVDEYVFPDNWGWDFGNMYNEADPYCQSCKKNARKKGLIE